MVTVYQYPQCSTCKKAIKWLEAAGVEFKLVHIVDKPPSKKTLSAVLKGADLPLKKLFNTSGQVYREGGYKEKLPTMSEKEALDELASQGKLIKRPLVVGDDIFLVGFKEAEYEAAFK